MLELRLKPPLAFPGRAPRLNRQHPLFSNQHIISAPVAQGKALVDLATGQVATNTTTLAGMDHNGSYIWSNDNAGTATVSLTGNPSTFNFMTMGCIFRLISASGRGNVYATNNTGFFIINTTASFLINNGSWWSAALIPGHAYFCFLNNAVGTASATKTGVVVDLDTGQVQTIRAAASGNLQLGPILALQVISTFVQTTRFYAGFMTGSVLIPPAVQPTATFGSIDQIMGGIADPWSLWYG